MSSDSLQSITDIAIDVQGVSKCYPLYEKPIHRMWQSLLGGKMRFYREFWALRDIGFQLRRGETLGIIGRNGAGKSTLLQIIAGTLKTTQGQAKIHGRVAALLELGSGFNPEFTGRQNVYLNAAILGLSHREIDARIGAILEYAEIGEFIDQPVRNYSTGMMMRLAFAVIVHVDADILIIDEALAVGDAFFVQKCMRFLREFRARGTMLFVSHDISAVIGLCDRAVWLEDGALKHFGDARAVAEDYLAAASSAGQQKARGKGKPLLPSKPLRVVDPRQAVIDRSLLRNDVHLFPFTPEVEAFGELKAHVVDVVFCDENGSPTTMVVAGETVMLEIDLVVDADLESLIVGFYLKNRLGQFLFGDNTSIGGLELVPAKAGQTFRASFRFDMPRVGNGEFFIAVGLAEGTKEQHVIQHWVHEALRISAVGGDISTGLVGIPMHEVQLRPIETESQ